MPPPCHRTVLRKILNGLFTPTTEGAPSPLWFNHGEAARRLDIRPEELQSLGEKHGGVFVPITTTDTDNTTCTGYFLEQVVLMAMVDLGLMPGATANMLWEIARPAVLPRGPAEDDQGERG